MWQALAYGGFSPLKTRVKLDDKYTLESGRVHMTGIQALVRLPMDQMRLDRSRQLRTGCYISGYEGSPLGGYDFALQRAQPHLAPLNVHFQPGLNEDLAATAIYGSQIINVLGGRGPAKVDGVVGIWYGKGPGVDRSGDILRHGNLTGSPGNCAALLLAGDDHPCKSSSIPHQSDFSLYNVNIPTLYPGNTQEILDYGLYAIALSRYSGAWCALKLLTQTCDGGGIVEVGLDRYQFHTPDAGYQKRSDPRLVPGIALMLEHETNVRRIPAALDFLRANPGLNTLHGALNNNARIGIATAGKSYYDLRQTLADCGLADADLDSLGIRIAKFGMTYPLDPRFVEEFARGLDRIFVIEEKRSFLELQLRETLYASAHRPRIVGKFDEQGEALLQSTAELEPDLILKALGRVLPADTIPGLAARLNRLSEIHRRPREITILRTPSFCSGCPHSRSTLMAPDQVVGGCIGCAGMGFLMEDAGRGYSFAAHMGSEGAPWFGMAPFVQRDHIYQNIGDGTYFHSGSLAVQAAVAAGVNITYKLLYNGHVAMTGGQDAVGAIPVPALTRKLEAEGVKKIAIVAEDVSRYSDPGALARNVTVHERSEMAAVQRELEKIPGVTVLIFEQECAAEKRRLRSRGKYVEPVKRLVIHPEVCEGCGDCVKQSNCPSLHPLDTPLGGKMSIHQPSCNKDYACALGDCPSFVTVKVKPGTGLRKPAPAGVERALASGGLQSAPDPSLPPLEGAAAYRILSPGIGGTGVVTVNAILAAAAAMDGLHVLTLDQTGLAQKGGAVVSHLTLSRSPLAVSARINASNADLLLGYDLLGLMAVDNLKCAHPSRTAAAVNTNVTPTAESVRKRLPFGDAGEQIAKLERHTNTARNVYVDAAGLSERYFGTHMMANMILLGAAWQAGLVPLTRESIEAAIRLNGAQVERNLQAFALGRKPPPVELVVAAPLAPIDYTARLTEYQNAAYAREHADFVARVRAARPALADAVALHLYRLMAVKDEYEVARLLTGAAFERGLHEQWEAVESIGYNLHPPLLRAWGLNNKLALGPWFRTPLRILASLRGLRGGIFDIFGYAAHRRRERALVPWYRALVEKALTLSDESAARCLVELPETIRGYESIKDAAMAQAQRAALEVTARSPVSEYS
ncbi:MAG: indolepyruvate ferredoxin oxidoreductase family protein [Acidobacteria bacterium]|nr:indolepyruvate ferredoxin oxidoreductase family protein [Acidobacteriota bacterium]